MTAAAAEATTHGAAWDGFEGGLWRDAIDVRDFVQRNYTPHEGDGRPPDRREGAGQG